MRACLLTLLVACSSHPTGSSIDAPAGYVELACESHGTTFPALDKSCVAASDCFVADHMVSCCGTLTALGFNVASKSAFTTAESRCAAAYPGCGCATGPTTAEDGRSTLDGTISVRCDTGVCATYVP
jgi:hypothetical protein